MAYPNGVDWAATGSMLQGIGTIVGAGAVMWGAAKGTAAWKEQKRAERRLQMAEQILTATHRVRGAIAYVRGVMLWAHELNAAEEKLKEDAHWTSQTQARQKRLITAQAYYTRLNNTRKDQDALVDCLPMARALFSEELEKAVETLNRQFWIIRTYVDASVDDEPGLDADFTQKIRRAMYDIDPQEGEENEVTTAVNGAVATIERICVPSLRLDPPGP
ncbi:MAG: hypothetical protein E7773_00770 [Sphingomonas sp.]|uniref:hypothetical protein n=1 Tax=Sphingomonas sp. TaxID=28214 RepID=UPI0011FEAF7A|nr:hypothetical protein [Sphingomonas sp.]THD38319.1 MAG: hypothetical protein E7773_00770 [Sphingomonas sp.]